MSDVWSGALYQASFGGVEFDCLSTSDSMARAVAKHSYPRRDGADLQDMGGEARTTRCQLIFWERASLEGETATGNHLQRFAAFLAASRAGRSQDFVHPLTGTYRALIEELEFDATGEERDAITATCTFVEDSTQPAKFDPGSLLAVDSGAAAVAANAQLATDALAAQGIDSDVPSSASSLVDAWESDPTKSAREVDLELATAQNQIDGLVDQYELTTDIDRFPLYRRMVSLSYSLKRAAALFKQAQPQVIQITLAADQPLRVLVTETYGAAQAEARYADVMRMNDIEDPSLILAGTVLRAPSPRSTSAPTRRAA